MKKHLRLTALLASLLLSLAWFTGCGSKTQPDGTPQADTTAARADKTVHIGILQLVEHPALDAAREGFVEGLKEAGFVEGENLTIDYQNAQNEQANCQTIAGQFATDNLDLVLAIATPAAQAAANVITDTPVLITAVTDPVDAKLVDSAEQPGGNITGTSDRSPVTKQIELLTKLIPDAKKVTILYTSSEVNSELQAAEAKAAAEAAGLTVEIKTVSASNEVQQVVESVVHSTDALYIPTDNLLANSMGIVAKVANAAKVPVIGGEENQVNSGALATIGINYFRLGKQTAQMAVKILNGEAEPASMPIEYLEDTSLVINSDTAEEIGLAIPADLNKIGEDLQAFTVETVITRNEN